MTVQTIEIVGRRFVLLSEEEFRELERRAAGTESAASALEAPRQRFADVTPFVVSGESASEMLIRERR